MIIVLLHLHPEEPIRRGTDVVRHGGNRIIPDHGITQRGPSGSDKVVSVFELVGVTGDRLPTDDELIIPVEEYLIW